MTPREFDAHMRQWDNARDFQISMFADLHADVRNVALGVGWTPPAGKAWTRDMLMPGYKIPESAKPGDWRAEKARLGKMANKTPMTREERKMYHAMMRESQRRTAIANEWKREGRSVAEIMSMMNGGA